MSLQKSSLQRMSRRMVTGEEVMMALREMEDTASELKTTAEDVQDTASKLVDDIRDWILRLREVMETLGIPEEAPVDFRRTR
jgi:hypothetical protein